AIHRVSHPFPTRRSSDLGEDALKQAISISEALFSGDIKSLSAEEIAQGLKDVPTYETEKADIPLVDLLVAANISPSKRQAREDRSEEHTSELQSRENLVC